MESRRTMATPRAAGARTSARREQTPVRWRIAGRATLALTGALGVLLAPLPAQAAPSTPSNSAEAAALVAARGHDLEVVTEKFNEAREQLTAQRAAADAAAAALTQATSNLAGAQQHVRGVARSAYTGSTLGSLQALMTSDSADKFVDRVATLETIAGHQNGVLDQAASANVAAAAAQAAAQQAAAEAQTQFDSVAAQQSTLEAQVAEYQAAYDRLSAQEKQAALDAAAAAHAADTAVQRDTAGAGSGRASRAERAPVAVPAPPAPVVAGSQAAQVAVSTALAQRGKPYVWAAGGPGAFDCSGLTQYAYRAAGVALPHSSRMQSQTGRSVSRADLQPGDLVFFYSPVSHVGIYIGNGQMVHAPTSGDVVKVASVDSMGGFSGARRLAG